MVHVSNVCTYFLTPIKCRPHMHLFLMGAYYWVWAHFSRNTISNPWSWDEFHDYYGKNGAEFFIMSISKCKPVWIAITIPWKLMPTQHFEGLNGGKSYLYLPKAMESILDWWKQHQNDNISAIKCHYLWSYGQLNQYNFCAKLHLGKKLQEQCHIFQLRNRG